MIIKHLVELETVINEESNEPAAKVIIAMSEEERNQFFKEAGESMIGSFLTMANEGNSWAFLRIAEKASV